MLIYIHLIILSKFIRASLEFPIKNIGEVENMDLAFWSNVRHQSGVTAGVAVISVLWTELYTGEIAVTSNHISSKGVLERLRGGTERREKMARKEYCYNFGEPEYFRRLFETGEKYEVKLNDGMRYIPMQGNEEVQMFCGGGLQGVKKRLNEENFLIVDTACGYGSSSLRILQESDLVVVILPPEKEMIDAFFQSDTLFRRNSFFILGNYRTALSCWPSYLTKKYKIPKERIGVIPYDFGFEQAMREGTTVAYITANMNCSRRNEAYHFMNYATKTAISLREYAVGRRKILCGDCAGV